LRRGGGGEKEESDGDLRGGLSRAGVEDMTGYWRHFGEACAGNETSWDGRV